MQYDIMQVEDNSEIRRYTEKNAKRENLTYFGVSSLHALENALTESSAKIYIVDGRFPIDEEGQVILNAPQAIISIRKNYSDAKIILYSGEKDGDLIAQKNLVEFMDKGDYAPHELILKIKEKIN
ncbi:MAG: hypothetical protein WC916_01835 [Candidatus Woesearchaeota archaeon]